VENYRHLHKDAPAIAASFVALEFAKIGSYKRRGFRITGSAEAGQLYWPRLIWVKLNPCGLRSESRPFKAAPSAALSATISTATIFEGYFSEVFACMKLAEQRGHSW
jgi:hypothetical protein